MKHTGNSPLLPFFAAALSHAMFAAMTADKISYTVREGLLAALLAGLGAWAGLGLLRLLDGQKLCGGSGAAGRLGRGLLAAALAAAACQTLYELAAVYARQYEHGVFWVLLLGASLLTLTPALPALGRVSCAALALAGLAAALLAAGLSSQMRIRALSLAPVRLSAVWAAADRLFCFLPEYLALPAVAGQQKHWGRLPLWTALCQAGLLLASELVFGFSAGNGRYPAGEVLRAWSLGFFSRMDALWTGLWLVLAMLRLLLIRSICLQLWPQMQGKQVRHEA